MGWEETFLFPLNRRYREPIPELVKGSVANHNPRAPALKTTTASLFLPDLPIYKRLETYAPGKTPFGNYGEESLAVKVNHSSMFQSFNHINNYI